MSGASKYRVDVIEGVVGAALHGMRLDRAVALVADVSRSVASQLVRDGAVRVGGVVVTSGTRRIAESERLAVVVVENQVASRPETNHMVQFATVYCDEDVVVVDKPAGLVVHPGAGHADGTLVNGLLARYPQIVDVGESSRPGIVHRLDRDTSGLLVVALNTRAYETLTAQFRVHQPERVYSALVWGHPTADVGVIEAPVGRSNRNPTRMVVTERGKHAVTHYQVRDRFVVPDIGALLSCRLETGRTHQIRVHMQAIGHPVVGDLVYGGFRSGVLSSTFSLSRPFLHAGSLAFRHPRTGKTLRFVCDLPDELATAIFSCRTS